MEKRDFYLELSTAEEKHRIRVSMSDNLDDGPHCILQIGPEINMTCVYLTDAQIESLVSALQAYQQADL